MDAAREDAFSAPTPDADLDSSLDANLDADAAWWDLEVGSGDGSASDARLLSDSDTSRPDGGAVHDVGIDARAPAGTCGAVWTRGDPLPPSCLPRCAGSTRAVFEACAGDPICEGTVMLDDPTPSAAVFVVEARASSEVDCSGCVAQQRVSCWKDACPRQARDWQNCLLRRPPELCARERAMLDACLASRRAEVDACARTRVTACFAGSR